MTTYTPTPPAKHFFKFGIWGGSGFWNFGSLWWAKILGLGVRCLAVVKRLGGGWCVRTVWTLLGQLARFLGLQPENALLQAFYDLLALAFALLDADGSFALGTGDGEGGA